jgi:hypothetical protein
VRARAALRAIEDVNPGETIMRITVLDCARGVHAIYKNQDFEDFQLKQGFYDPKNLDVGDEGYSVGLYKYLPNPDTYLLSVRGSAKGKLTKD